MTAGFERFMADLYFDNGRMVLQTDVDSHLDLDDLVEMICVVCGPPTEELLPIPNFKREHYGLVRITIEKLH